MAEFQKPADTPARSGSAEAAAKVIVTVACDLEESPLGTRSRLLDLLNGVPVLVRTLRTVQRVTAVSTIVLLVPEGQQEKLRAALEKYGPDLAQVEVMPLIPRPASTERRMRAARAWNVAGWRGGAGQWMVFDEDYYPAAVGAACRRFAADHVLSVPAHGALLDAELLSALVHHHLFKNHEMRVTYMPAAPGLAAMALRADIVAEMAAAAVMPMHLLGYDPKAPSFDTLIRDACMQVDPALSKIPNRFLVDTERSWQMAEKLLARGPWDCLAALALAARDLAAAEPFHQPREVQIELTAERLTHPPGAVPAEIAQALAALDATDWVNWFGRQQLADDLLLTFGGDGDPLRYADLPAVLRAARQAGARHIHVQTDLLSPTEALVSAMREGLVDVLSVNYYGDDAATYAAVAGMDGFAMVNAHLETLGAAATQTLVIPRLLKVRQTIPHLEPFFDRWINRLGWAVIDGPTDRAGAVPFAGVVDMAPPKRRPCRRLGDRLVLRADGTALACDQDIHGRLVLGHIQSHSLDEIWQSAARTTLGAAHATGAWAAIDPCRNCREWHRA